ncbi:MAG: hypothetical protein KAW12_22675 [Candidatus Aminicenantes bacterium]|nr:hypothetical protein [Candidatus Aminicenantes bacterium]
MQEKKPKSTRTGLEIAVIGMAGRFPGAADIDVFWENLKNGVESVTFFSDEELIEAGIDPELIKQPNYVKARGCVEDIEYFDAAFFNYTPREAEVMDPQVRIFHQCAYHALENAAYDTRTYSGLIGLYAGYAPNLYWKVGHLLQTAGGAESMAIGNLNNNHFTANICYKLNLKGPAISINTTCSTSLVAIHMACRALLTGETDMALAGGVSLPLPAKTGYVYQEGMLMSSDGRCRPFDAKADGMASGSGAGVVLLKRLVKAVKDRDFIYAVIKGSAVNNDGNRKAGYNAPSVEGQAEVIRAALKAARVEPASINYIETHGTGTAMGDPIEIEALKKAFISPAKTPAYEKHSCAIGFVKANTGHMDAAAGVAGFIKTVLALNHRLIPPAVNFETPNPAIDFENSPFYVNTELKEWQPAPGCDGARAGISAYGIGGTNAHVVLEEYNPGIVPGSAEKPGTDSDDPGNYYLLPLSAKTQTALKTMTGNLIEYLKKNPAVNLADVAYTLQVGRRAWDYRRMVICSSVEEAVRRLETGTPGRTHDLDGQDPGQEQTMAKLLAEARREKPPPRDLLQEIGDLWLNGVEIDRQDFNVGEERNRVPLPSYPFEKQYYSIDLPLTALQAQAREGAVNFAKREQSPAVFKDRPESKIPYMPPRNKAEEILVRMWEELLGIRPIGINDDLPAMGVDSLKAIMFVNKFKEELGEIIHVTGVFEAPTVGEFALHFSSHYPESKALTGEEVTAAPEIPANFVMLHRPKKAVGNIFLVHEICGDVGAYLDFSIKAGTPYNIWGIEAEKLKNYTPQNVTIEEVAARYIRQIKTIQPHGPYYLGTWSFGGNWGIEMALQLEQMGEELAFLAFFDCSGPNGRIDEPRPQFTPETEKAFLKNFLGHIGKADVLEEMADMEQLWTFAVDILKSDETLVEGLRQLLIENEKAIPNYQSLNGEELVQFMNAIRTFGYGGSFYIPAGKIHTPIHYFRVEDNPDREDYWGDYCHNPVIYHEIKGDHHSIFRDKGQIVEFARKFSEVLKQKKEIK